MQEDFCKLNVQDCQHVCLLQQGGGSMQLLEGVDTALE